MLEQAELEQRLNNNRLKYTHDKVSHSFKTWNKTIEYYFPDREESWYFTLKKGQPGPLKHGSPPTSDIKYEMDTETFKRIDDKELKGMAAYRKKLVKVKAKMPDLVKLQKLDRI